MDVSGSRQFSLNLNTNKDGERTKIILGREKSSMCSKNVTSLETYLLLVTGEKHFACGNTKKKKQCN